MSNKTYTFVSIFTVTFNRRPFIPYLIKCIEQQTYPKDKIEWVICDDGSDPIKDLVEHLTYVKYFRYDEHLLLGKKRNLMNAHCSGDILVYMDDDDYYPPERISHAVDKLTKSDLLIAGSSELHMYAKNKNKIFKFGPYGPNHATAASFAFKKQLLNQTKFNDESAFGEEKTFLKEYTIPMIQLDVTKTILVCAHQHNSIDRESLLEYPENCKVTSSCYTLDDFFKDDNLKIFYTKNIHGILNNYELGKKEHKQEMHKQLNERIKQTQEKIKNDNLMLENHNKLMLASNQKVEFNNIEKLKQHYEKRLENNSIIINEMMKKIKTLTTELDNCKKLQNT